MPAAQKTKANLRMTRWYPHLFFSSGRNACLHSRFSLCCGLCAAQGGASEGVPVKGLSCFSPCRLRPEAQPSGVQEGPRPDASFLYVSLWFSTAWWNVFLSGSLGTFYVSLFADGEGKQIDKQGRIIFSNKPLFACLILKCVLWV